MKTELPLIRALVADTKRCKDRKGLFVVQEKIGSPRSLVNLFESIQFLYWTFPMGHRSRIVSVIDARVNKELFYLSKRRVQSRESTRWLDACDIPSY